MIGKPVALGLVRACVKGRPALPVQARATTRVAPTTPFDSPLGLVGAGLVPARAHDRPARPVKDRATAMVAPTRAELPRAPQPLGWLRGCIGAILLAVGLLPGAAQAASALAEVVESNARIDGVDLAKVDALYNETILEAGHIDLLVRRLGVLAGNRGRTAGERANHHLTIAHIHWRHGDHESALAAVDGALELQATADALLLKARILDATGDPDSAGEWYERAAGAYDDAETKEFIRIRLTMAEANDRNIDALVDLANQRDQAFRNRAAIALALLGHAEQAVKLYDPAAGTGDSFRQHVRFAHWAIESGNLDLAQDAAWTAYRQARTRVDGLYALGLWVESYRKSDSLPALLARLDEDEAGAGQTDPNLVQVRIDVLTETENYDEAIRFYETAGGTAVDVDARRRLIKLYEAAGRPEDMVAEYEKLMEAEPDVVAWFAGLASHYLNRAEPDNALAVWETLATRNADRVDVLVQAAESMVNMGFVDEAVAMIEGHGDSLEGLLFLFNLRLGRGENDQALATLQRLESALPDGATGIRDVADAYERLNRPDDAIRILETLRERQGELGYDERMRLAWLYSVAGRKADAMAAWRTLWVSVDSAARRSLAENQFLLLATELNALGDLVVDLEEKLALKEADRNEIGLLVRIYTEVGDTLSATEVIDEFSRQGETSEVDRLRQLGRVHRMLANFSAYDRVLRQLYAADPGNELEHAQNIVLNMLAYDLAEDSTDRFAEIQDWLGRLRNLDAEGVSGEFEAGIFSLGGFNDEAIESYRRALVLHPENSDNLLLMADLMKTAGRRDEAVAILQYAAEHAIDDAGFVVAIDGIINMIGARSFTEDLTSAMRKTFGWTRRVILERIAGRNDKFYLYQLLADIAQEIGDTEAEFVALENSLSESGVRRPAVLRELVTLATPNTGFGGFTTGTGDAERQITHGRRLIALQQELPPEVYINLGKVLLDEGAVQGAVRAFDLIDDITGLINVDTTKADLFLEAGHPDEALNWYARALNVSRDDLSLLTRTAMLRETTGQEDVANALYFRAIANVLRGLSKTRRNQRPGANQSPMARLGLEDTDTSVTRDYRLYYESIVQGLLITWPDDREFAGERLAAARAMFDEELATVLSATPEDAATPKGGQSSEPFSEPTADKPALDGFPRLERTARFARRAAERAGEASLVAYLDTTLATHFAKDVTLAGDDPNTPLLRRHLEMAKRTEDFEAAVRLARLAGDEEDLIALFRDRIAEGNYREGLAYARSLLDDTAFKRLTAVIAPTLKDNRESFRTLLEADPDLVLEIESDLGRELISVEELLDLLDDPEDSQQIVFFYGSGGAWDYLKAKGSVDDQLRHLASSAARHKRGQFGRSGFSTMLRDLLAVEMTAAQREILAAATTEYLEKQDLTDEYARMTAIELVLVPDAHPENRAVIYDLTDMLQQRAQFTLDLTTTLKSIIEGTDEAAFAALVELRQAGFRYFGGSVSGEAEKFASIRRGILESARQGTGEHDAETVRIVYEFDFPPYYGVTSRSEDERRVEVLPGLIRHYPDEERYLYELAMAYFGLDRLSEAEATIVGLYQQNPEDDALRAALYFHRVYQERYQSALELLDDGGADLRDQAVVDELVARIQREYNPSSRLFQSIYQGRQRNPYSIWSPQVERSIEALREALTDPAAEADESLANTLRAVWRGADAPREDRGFILRGTTMAHQLLRLPLKAESDSAYRFGPYSNTTYYRLDALLSKDNEAEPKTLFGALAEEPFSAPEFGLYLRALTDSQRQDQHGLYELLATAVDAAGTRDAQVEALSKRLDEHPDHDFTVWMLLRISQEAPMPKRELDAFASRVVEIEDPTQFQTLYIARLFARADAFEESSEYYRLLAAKLSRHGEFVDRRVVFMSNGVAPDLIDLAALAREVATKLPKDIASDTIQTILATARRADRRDAYDAYFDAFLLKVLAELHEPKDVLAEAVRLSPNAATVGGPLGEWESAKAVELARLHARTGDQPKALDLLRALVVVTGAEAPPNPTSFDQERYELANAMQKLARLYGLKHIDNYLGPDDVRHPPLHELILRRERLFPANAEDRWTGDVAWMNEAADALITWLDDPNLDRAAILEAAFVVAFQLAAAGESDDAKAIVSNLATEIMADDDHLGLGHLVLMALHVGNALPTELATQALASGTLTIEQEAEVLEGIQRTNDPAAVLEVGRVADKGDGKLTLLALLSPLAQSVGDGDYAEDLGNRLRAEEDARSQLRLANP